MITTKTKRISSGVAKHRIPVLASMDKFQEEKHVGETTMATAMVICGRNHCLIEVHTLPNSSKLPRIMFGEASPLSLVT
jgi:hypothetical protein